MLIEILVNWSILKDLYLQQKNKYLQSKKAVTVALDVEYSFCRIDFSNIQNISDGLKKSLKPFHLVGDNWLEKKSKKPIVVLIGINFHQQGFISDYLPEYRCVFVASKKKLLLKLFFLLSRSDFNCKLLYIWRYKVPNIVVWYTRLKKIPIRSIDYGLISSANPGLFGYSFSYSLIFDKNGLHYNKHTSSDIENLLNNYNFDSDPTIINDAQETLKVILDLKILQYNPPCIGKNIFYSSKSRKQVLVIGQAKNDVYLQKGNPKNYNMRDLLILAKSENPTAQIVCCYDYSAVQKYNKKVIKVNNLYTVDIISLDDISLANLLLKVDHVYTISSLSGLEAILRNVKVTVLGTPFYAGWGVTNDRIKLKRRNRKLTKIQLFAISYLKYPRYLSNLKDSKLGLITTCKKIDADRELLYSKNISNIVNNFGNMKLVAQSKYWPKLFHTNVLSNDSNLVSKNLKFVDFARFFQNIHGTYAQIAIVGYIFSKISITDICKLLYVIRQYLNKEALSIILIHLWKYYQNTDILNHYVWYLDKVVNNHFLAQKMLDDFNALNEHKVVKFSEKIIQQKYSAIQIHIERKNFEEALEELYKLCICGSSSLNTLYQFIKISNLKFDFDSSVEIASFCKLVDISFSSGKISSIIAQNLIFSRHFSEQRFCLELIHANFFNFSIENLLSIATNNTTDDQKDNYEALLLETTKLHNTISFPQVNTFLSLGKYEKAIQLCEQLIFRKQNVSKVILTLSKIYRTMGKFDLAYDCIIQLQDCTTISYHGELLKILLQLQRFSNAKKLLDKLIDKRIELGPSITFNVLISNKMIEEAFKCYPCMNFSNTIANYFKDKYRHFENLSKKSSIKNILLLSSYGPGDEIRFASLYNDFVGHFGLENVKISCDTRLLELFQRSFIQINFIPIRRTRHYNQQDHSPDFYKNLPGSELHTVLDNSGLEEIKKSNYISLVSDLIWHFRKKCNDFPGVPYLKADPDKVSLYKNKLKNKPQDSYKLIGLNWSSSLNTCSRNIHYLSIEELEPIFQIDNIQFVNFQYFKCDEELKWIEERYPNKIINFAEINQYNDFDSVAALMSCMDLIIAPCTSVLELAGALGCKAWLFSNSSESCWRKINKEKVDIWYNNVNHVEGKVFGNKFSLVEELTKKLKEWILEA